MPLLAGIALGFQLGLLCACGAFLSNEQAAFLAVGSVAASLGLSALAHTARAPHGRSVRVALAAAAFAAGLAIGPPSAAPAAVPPPGLARMTAQVEEVRYAGPDVARTRIRILEGARLADRAPIAPGTRLWLAPAPLADGALVQLVAAVSPRVAFRNPSPHPELPASQATRGHARLPSLDSVRVLEQPWSARFIDGARREVRQRLHRTLPPTAAAVACALILGDIDDVADEDRDDVRAAGLTHVFAVSGMHVTLLAGSCVLALGWLLGCVYPLAARFDPRRIAAGLGVPLALGIAVITGGSPSGYRAAITSAFAWSLSALGRRPDALSVTAAACLAFAAATPEQALRPAFLLSVAATAAIVTMHRRTRESTFDPLRAALALTLRTSLATAPLVLWMFGNVPPLGVLANLALVPLGSCVLVLTALHALLASASPALSGVTAPLLQTGAVAFLAGSSAFANASPKLSWPVLDAWQGLVICGVVCVLLFARSRRSRLLASSVGIAALALLELRLRYVEQPLDRLRVTFLDVGQGDAALVDLPDGTSMLIDAGGNPEGGPDPGERAVLPLLRARRRTAIDLAVLSHPHPDHYGGLRAVLHALPIRELWDSGQAEAESALGGTSSVARELLREARQRGVRVLGPELLCGAPRRSGGAQLEVLWPCPRFDAGYDPNDNSLVVRIRYGAHAFLFAGDIEGHAEAALVERARRGLDLRADVLKVPHHGSRTSSSAALIGSVAPRVAIISAGASNRFGHPHPDVVARLRASVPNVVDIGATGAAVVETDGVTLRVGARIVAVAPKHTSHAARGCIP